MQIPIYVSTNCQCYTETCLLPCMPYLEHLPLYLTNQLDKAVCQFSPSFIRRVLFQIEFKLHLIFISIQFITVYQSNFS